MFALLLSGKQFAKRKSRERKRTWDKEPMLDFLDVLSVIFLRALLFLV